MKPSLDFMESITKKRTKNYIRNKDKEVSLLINQLWIEIQDL